MRMGKDVPPSEKLGQEIHRRLLAGEEDATLDLAELYFEPLLLALRAKWSGLPDLTEVDTAVGDAVLVLAKRPSAYNPSKGSLWSFLYTIAHRHLQSLYRKAARGPRIISLEEMDVELQAAQRNTGIEAMVMRRLGPEGLPDDVEVQEIVRQVALAFQREPDRSLLPLVLDGVRETSAYAELMEIGHLPIAEQRRQVKQAKDRINVRLTRLRSKLGG